MTVAGIAIWTVVAFGHRPVLVYSPGDWNCACGEMYIKTTIRAIWNPFRDRQPEIVAERFLLALKANECAAGPELCQATRRVSAWKLTYREDAGDMAALFYKLTKYGSEPRFSLTGVGAIDLRKTPGGWRVVGYDCYF